MKAIVNFLLSLSILFPFIVCLLRIRVMKKSYYPFVILIFGATFTELVAYYLAITFKTNLWFLNIYSLFESLILVYQFHRWGFMQTPKGHRFKVLFGLMIIAWLVDNLILSSIHTGNRYYLIAYSFMLVMLSIRQINQDMMSGKNMSDQLARLILCTAITLFFTFGIIRETFTVFAKGLQPSTHDRIFIIITITNVITNLIFAVGAYYIPKQKDWPVMFNMYERKL